MRTIAATAEPEAKEGCQATGPLSVFILGYYTGI